MQTGPNPDVKAKSISTSGVRYRKACVSFQAFILKAKPEVCFLTNADHLMELQVDGFNTNVQAFILKANTEVSLLVSKLVVSTERLVRG